MNVFECKDITKRMIYLSRERYFHLMKHKDLQNNLDLIKICLARPLKIIPEGEVNFYYFYCKERKWKEKS